MNTATMPRKEPRPTPTLLRIVRPDETENDVGDIDIDFTRRRSAAPRTQRRMAAVLFVDMVGYSRLMQEDERRAHRARSQYRHALSIALRTHDGELIQHYGDGALVIFSSTVDAVRAEIEVQRRLRTEPAVPVRIGIHVADIVRDSEGIYGDGVNIAARIQRLCPAGGVMVSESVRRETQNHRGLDTVPMGGFDLKNIREPMRVHGVLHPSVAPPKLRRNGVIDASDFPAWVPILAMAITVAAGILIGMGL